MRVTDRQIRENEPTIDDMRHDLAEQEAMNMGVGDIISLLKDGFEGLENMPDIEIRDEWNSLFGDPLKAKAELYDKTGVPFSGSFPIGNDVEFGANME